MFQFRYAWRGINIDVRDRGENNERTASLKPSTLERVGGAKSLESPAVLPSIVMWK